MKNKTYIYSLIDPTTKQIRYIGKADNPTDRLYKHLADKRVNHRTCWIKSLKKKGLKPIVEILAIVDKKQWQNWERFFIKYYKGRGFKLVNGTLGGDGVVATDEVRKKISNKLSRKQVLQYSLEGELVKVYRNCVNAGKDNEILTNCIQGVCVGKNQSAGGFMWQYHIKGDEMLKTIKPYKRIMGCRKPTRVKQLDTDKNLVAVFNSINEASRKTGTDRSSIQLCLRGETKQANGFLWAKCLHI